METESCLMEIVDQHHRRCHPQDQATQLRKQVSFYHRVSFDVWRQGDDFKAKQTCLLCQRVLQVCGRHFATQPLLLYYIACSKALPPHEHELGFCENVAPQSLRALGYLLPGCVEDLTDMLRVAKPYVEHLMEGSKLDMTAEVLRDL